MGKRISIKATRSIITAILEGKLDESSYRHDSLFNLEVPKEVPLVDSYILKPKELWSDKKGYDVVARSLVAAFQENFKKFEKIPHAIIDAGPQL